MTDRPRTPKEKGVRMYSKPAWLSKWLVRRNQNESSTEQETARPRTPKEKGVRMYDKPAWLSKWYIRRMEAREKADGDFEDRSVLRELIHAFGEWIKEKKPNSTR